MAFNWKDILLAVLTLNSIACGTTTTSPLIEFPTFEQLSPTSDTKLTRTAILTSTESLGWIVKDEKDGQIDVYRSDQNRLAAIRITYDENVVNLQYLRSANFDCEPSGLKCKKIHRLYGEWVERLRSWINHEIELEKIPPELKRETIKRFDAPVVRIGNSEPGSNYKQIGPISGVNGKGCGLFGRRGTYEKAIIHLKKEARRLGASYVQIIQLIEPHQSSINCFDNRYQIRAFAYKELTSDFGDEEKTVVQGTCFSVSPEGLVLTNHHVIENTKKILVRFEDGSLTEAKIAIASPEKDLVLLRLATAHLAYLPLAKSETLQIGQEVFTMGYPAQTILGSTVKYSEGSISSLGINNDKDFLLQISVPIQPGNSGGPLVTNSGEVVGVVTATAAIGSFFKLTGSFPQNVSWAVKTDYVTNFFDQPDVPLPTKNRKEAIERVKSAVCSIEAE